MKINIHMLIFLILALIAAIADIIIYIFKLNYISGLIISVIINMIALIYIVRKKKIVVATDFEKIDLFIILIAVLFNMQIFLLNDTSFDAMNYHFYLQEYCFNDKINFDFFPGRAINGFLFPLGDRIFYIFRSILGYRLGSIPSLYTLVILYYQMKKILRSLQTNMSNRLVHVFSGLTLFMFTACNLIGAFSYYIDNFSMILLIEIVYIFIKINNIFEEKNYLYYTFLLLGVATSIKVPNLILGGFILIAIILKKSNIQSLKENYKNKKVILKDIFICITLFVMPFIIYAIDNYIQTGSPIFPYYNKIFKSEYFDYINWQDSNFGIPNILYAFIWPICILFDPSKTNDAGVGIFIIWACGYICSIVYVILKRKEKNDIWKLSILNIFLTWLWAIFLMGYARYAMVVPIIYYIICYCIIFELYNSIKNIKVKNVFYSKIKLASFILIICCLICDLIGSIRIKANDWFCYKDEMISNIKMIFEKNEDSKDSNENNKYEIDGVWGSMANTSRNGFSNKRRRYSNI